MITSAVYIRYTGQGGNSNDVDVTQGYVIGDEDCEARQYLQTKTR